MQTDIQASVQTSLSQYIAPLRAWSNRRTRRLIIIIIIGNRTWPMKRHQCQCPSINLEVTFADWNLSNCHTSWNV